MNTTYDRSRSPSHHSDRFSHEIPANEAIRDSTIFLIDDQSGQPLGTFSLSQALLKAHNAGLDLVKIGDGPHGAVCKILDYKKYLYSMRKKSAHARKAQKSGKEIKLQLNIGTKDYGDKLRKIREFVADKHKVKVTLRFRGRENAHQDLGVKLMRKVLDDLAQDVRVEVEPKLNGSQISMLLGPRSS